MRYVGMDVHKRSVRVCILDKDGARLVGETVDCTREALGAFCRERLRKTDAVVMEATTNCWAVADVVRPHVRRVVVSNPLKTKAIAEAKVKTDKVDAEVLGQLLRCDYLPEVWEPDGYTRQLRQLTTVRTGLMADRTRIKNRVQSVLAQRLILCPYATLFAKRSIAWLRSLDLDEQDRYVVDGQLQLLAGVEAQIVAVDQRLQSSAMDDPHVKLLMTLPGVSHATAVALWGAIGDISRFRDGDHLASYLGLVPLTRQSAEHCYHGHITKAGNSTVRWMLTQGVQHLAHHPGPLGAFFRRMAKRKNRQVAVIATARKLVTIAYLMLKNNEPYRYAQPEVVHRKFTRLHHTAKEGACPPATTLPQLCRDEGLPPVRTFEELPAGERRVLRRTGTTAFARRVGSEPNARNGTH